MTLKEIRTRLQAFRQQMHLPKFFRFLRPPTRIPERGVYVYIGLLNNLTPPDDKVRHGSPLAISQQTATARLGVAFPDTTNDPSNAEKRGRFV